MPKGSKPTKPAAKKDAQQQPLPPPEGQPPSAGSGNAGFLPPGACLTSRNRRNAFENDFEPHFEVPERMRQMPIPLVEAVNDFHFAMMNDTPRNEFYYGLLKQHITPESGVLEIGAGSGLLSMMAAKLGAKWVVAVEGSDDMARLARRNVYENGLQDKVTVLCMMSTDLTVKDLPGRPDILVSEIFGTLLLGESAHDYIEDIRKRVLKPDARILPRHGVQYAVPIECPTLESITSIGEWNGLNLRHVNAVKDTASTVFTKKYGFRMSSVPFRKLAKPLPVVTLDFHNNKRKDIRRVQTLDMTPTESGTVNAMLLFWESTDGEFSMSTDPDATRDNFPRDMQWGQALQLIDGGNEPLPKDFKVVQGETVAVKCRSSNDGVLLQFTLTHKKTSQKPETAAEKKDEGAKPEAAAAGDAAQAKHADPSAEAPAE
jgi:protein arginine N-methyltransferase 7